MLENLKYCAGEMAQNLNSPIQKIKEKSTQFLNVCQQLKVGEAKSVVWNLMR